MYTELCKTKYPILMLHGMGFHDGKICYWGRIPKALEQNGAGIFFGMQDSHACVEENAKTVKRRIEHILKETNAEKVNIIAHSKGGLEARFVISSMGMQSKVASLTTISTPHNGSKTVDFFMDISQYIPKPILSFGFGIFDAAAKLLGDKHPDTLAAVNQFRTSEATKFNIANPDMDEVYYQSYSFVMKNIFSDIFMALPYAAVKAIEGDDNDGLLTPASTKWTNWQGIYKGQSLRGISHFDEVDARRCALTKKKGENISDIVEFYINIVKGLKDMGF